MELIFWTVLIVVFAIVEIITVGLASIWFAGGALVALICSAIGLDFVWQIVVFFAVSAVLLIFTRPWAMKFVKPKLSRTNYETALEQKVCVTEDIDNIKGTGAAVFKGQEWTARAYDENQKFSKGEIVRVKEIRGVTMYVEADE